MLGSPTNGSGGSVDVGDGSVGVEVERLIAESGLNIAFSGEHWVLIRACHVADEATFGVALQRETFGTKLSGVRHLTETRRILLDGNPTEVVVADDELVAADGRRVAAAEATHLAPSQPSKIICVHLNYKSRVDEFMTKLPAAPTYFHKPVSSLVGHGASVVRPDGCEWLNYEGEIAIIIGRTCRNVSPDEVGDYIEGYSVANDYGLHDFRDTDAGSMLRVKGSDTLCPVGPGLVRDWDFHNKQIRTIVNGEVKQDGNTSEMEWDMHYLVADIARSITLVPGDILLSGTPANSRTVYPGDVVTVEVEGLGAMTNTIVQGPAPIRTDVGAQPSDSEEVMSTAQGGDWEFRGIRAPMGPGAKYYKSKLDSSEGETSK